MTGIQLPTSPIGRSPAERISGRRCSIAALSVLLLVLAATAALAQEGPEPGQPPEPVAVVGEISCAPRTPVAGDTLTCAATGAEGVAQLEVELLLYAPPRGQDVEGVLYQDEQDVVLVEDGVATFDFVISDQAIEGDQWEVYGWMISGSQQDCFVLDREAGQVVATGALQAEDAEAFLVGGETFSWELFALVCTDEIRFDAGDRGLIGAAPGNDDKPVPPDAEPGTPDKQPGALDKQLPAVGTDVIAQSPISEADATPATEPDDGPLLPATGAALPLLLVTGVLAVGGGLSILRR
jgi:hypothetical protein